jgi:uncharacterized membrane protein YphA (DoxX/SURF4 family)
MAKIRANKDFLAFLFRLAIGLLLVLSSTIKALDVSGFAKLLHQYDFDWAIALCPLLILAEAACGICLLLNIYPKLFSLLTMTLLLGFTFVYLYAYIFRAVTDCGCFGRITWLNTSPPLTIIRNLSMITLMFLLWQWTPWQKEKPAMLNAGIALAALVVVVFLTGNSYAHLSTFRSIHPMYQKSVRETVLPQILSLSADSTYMVFIFSYRCEGCWDYFDNVRRYADTPTVADRVVCLAAGKDSNAIFQRYFQPLTTIIEVEEKTLTELTATAPSTFYIAGDTIRHIIVGSIPTRYLFEKNYLEIIK